MKMCQKYIIYTLLITFNIFLLTQGDPYGNDTIIKHINSSNVATEGGIVLLNKTDGNHTDNGIIKGHDREGVTHREKVNVSSTMEIIKPVIEEQEVTTKKSTSSTKHTELNSKIKPRKGAPVYAPENVTSSTTTTTTTTTTTVTTTTTTKPPTTTKKMKPRITESDDEPFPPSNFVPSNVKKTNGNSSLKLNEHTGGDKYFKKSPDYVLPIVLTILAVPLVAILLTVLFKHGSEWWQHRHYRRMDFLIEGIYNN